MTDTATAERLPERAPTRARDVDLGVLDGALPVFVRGIDTAVGRDLDAGVARLAGVDVARGTGEARGRA